LSNRSLFAIVCCGTTRLPQAAPMGLRLGQLVGRAVHDARGEPIGRVDDVIVPPNGTAATAIVALGDARLVAVPLPRLRLDADRVMLAGEIATLPEYRYA
jgi:sporulation protein YlmC with PRC-barrel domain